MSVGSNKIRFLKDSVPKLLMVFSLVLLLLLQVAWLRGAYHEARENFRAQTNSLFRNTIFALHDSLVMRNIEPISGDSILHGERFFTGHSRRNIPGGDTAMNSVSAGEPTTSVEVFISHGSKDSVRQFLKPLMRRMRTDAGHKKFFIRFGADTLQTDSIAFYFAGALRKAELPLSFKVHRIQKTGPKIKYPSGALVSDPVFFHPMNHYTVSFRGTNAFFIRSITPEILFSLFVTLLTAASFYLMNHSIRSQKNLVKIKNDFISNITHELKTPVATISVALEAMEKFKALDDRQKTKEYLDMAQNELSRLVLMTDKILQTASIENNQPDMKAEEINLDIEVKAVLKSMKLVFEKQQIEVRYECKGVDFVMHGSRAHLITVLYNLLDNAIKYSPASSMIVVSLEARQNEILLSVKDQGIGIPDEYQRKIFEKFFRVPSGDVHNTKGYGLGLNYVAQVVEGHKGVIQVESHRGEGSTFAIRLPRNAVG